MLYEFKKSSIANGSGGKKNIHSVYRNDVFKCPDITTMIWLDSFRDFFSKMLLVLDDKVLSESIFYKVYFRKIFRKKNCRELEHQFNASHISDLNRLHDLRKMSMDLSSPVCFSA